MTFLNITINNFKTTKTTTEILDGREYLVVPMVMILEGVHDGSSGKIYYPKEELQKTPKIWNMKPIVVNHPEQGDTRRYER
jgi:hypothetical protein